MEQEQEKSGFVPIVLPCEILQESIGYFDFGVVRQSTGDMKKTQVFLMFCAQLEPLAL